MRLISLSVLLAALLAIGSSGNVLAQTDAAAAPEAGVSTHGMEGAGVAMEPVANAQYQLLPGVTAQNGSDIEFLKVGTKEYALAGTLRNGMQIVDITNPNQPTVAAVYECPINQGDIQVFRQGERILATYTADAAIAPTDNAGARSEINQARFESQCVKETNDIINAQGEDELDGNQLGTFIVDLTDPTAPKTVGFANVPEGSHNMTVHPSGDYLYNSNSDLITGGPDPKITIFDIRDPANPKKVQDFPLTPYPTSLGTESHDLFFNALGTRASVAALSHTAILDTSNPEQPEIITEVVDPSNQVVHQAEFFSLPREDGSVRDLLITDDERAGAAASAECPGGGIHVYDITGELEQNPQKLGTWFIDDQGPSDGPTEICTSHVFRTYPDQQLMTIAWYSRGARVLDLSGLAEFQGTPATIAFGDGVGIKEVGNYVFDDANVWAFKTNRIEGDGSFFGYGNDRVRGLDVFRFDAATAELGRTVPELAPEDFAAPGCTGVPVASAYVDRAEARDTHERSIDCVIARSIARGSVKNAQRFYEPLADVTRGQMATFIVNTMRSAGVDAEFPPAPAEDKFTDLGENPHKANINLLAEAGIINGVGGDEYAPDALVTREQMATFMVKAADFAVEPNLVESGGNRFSDVGSSTHRQNIEIGSDNGLFSGTSPGRFRPGRNVLRDQMASFLVNLLLRLGGPDGPSKPVVGPATG